MNSDAYFVVPSLRSMLRWDAQTLVEVFYWPLVRWFEQQQNAVLAATRCPVSRADIDSVFSNVDELLAFSR